MATPAWLSSPSRRRLAARAGGFLTFTTLGAVLFAILITTTLLLHWRRSTTGVWADSNPHGPVLVSYSYFEKDPVQVWGPHTYKGGVHIIATQLKDAEFFFAVGMGIKSTYKPPPSTHFSIVVNGDVCNPCQVLYPLLRDTAVPESMTWLKLAKVGRGLTFLWRNENEGMDFAAHNATLEWYLHRRAIRRYKFFIFLNSSVRGPFYPSYMPSDWFWTRAYTDYLRDDVKAVSSSVVCLPQVDAGGFGAKLESWAFALDLVGLQLLMRAGTFSIRTCKLCTDGVVVQGEYGITNVLFKNGYNIATLMHKYGKQVDWRDSKNWWCNNNAHPSRHGTYDGISMHPFEVVFLKASWHVGEPFVKHYTEWEMDKAYGKLTTRGHFDEAMYRWAIQLEAQDEPIMEPCFNVLAFDVRTNKPLNRRKGYKNPEEVAEVRHRALPEAETEQEAAPLDPLDKPTFGKPVLEEGEDS